jgi:signal transduction histidine kinase
LNVLTDENGKPVKIIGVNFDITERKVMEKSVLRAEKLASIGTLSAGVAHEILNPLNIIGTIVQVMLMDEWPVRAKENIQEIMTQVRRATKITNNLRKFAHQRKPERTLLDMHALFDKTVMLLEHDLQLDNIHVQRDFGPDLPAIYADEDQMAQVFLNLLNNARDAMRKSRKGIITIKTRMLGNGVEIRFSDDGPGIPADIIGKVFDPFFTTKSPGEGTGLGLSMLLKIMEEHKGSITVESKEGKGATFIIHLPARMKGDRENGA